MTIDELKKISQQVRRDVIRMISNAGSGHPGGSLGCADFLTTLYFKFMRIKPENFKMDGYGEDVFILSNGHISAAWYSVLARRGYFSIKELSTFRKINSRLQGHPSPSENLPGVRIATGSLGQGLSVAIGIALAKKLKKDPYLTYVLLGDGELQEGQIWEALMFAGAKKVDNLIAIVDYNGLQIDGKTDEVCSLGDLHAKFIAFDWYVLQMNGNDIEDIVKTMNVAIENTGKGKPVIIIMKTIMGYGVDFMMNNHKWHGTPPNLEETQRALQQLPSTLEDF
ncbi:MAG: transketolase [Bacteroidales bacterium]|nr:transketolase [Bacteroidales bacterium]